MNGRFKNYFNNAVTGRFAFGHSPSIMQPDVISVRDANGIEGHGVGFDDSILKKAKGEYIERLVAFRSVKPVAQGRIAELSLTQPEKSSLSEAIQQCAPKKFNRSDLQNHLFDLVEVQRVGSEETVLYPLIFFSLHDSGSLRDGELIPERDSSGSALHETPQLAMRGALLEFVERQSVIAMWVARRCNSLLSLNSKSLVNSQAQSLATQMSSIGNLFLYDISFLEGAHVFAVEFNSKTADAIIHFSCGFAASFSSQDAIQKALIESWQGSLLLSQIGFFGANHYGSGTLTKNFNSSNKFGFSLELQNRPIKIGGSYGNDPSLDKVVESLRSVSSNIYVFRQSILVNDKLLYFCKISSPDFYIHMNPLENNNIDNKWISNFCNRQDMRLEPLPFS